MAMKLKLAAASLAVAAALAALAAPAQAQYSGDVVRIGITTDMSSLYSDLDGEGGVEAIRMAIADMGGSVNGKKIEVVFADHQNKADIASSKAREWFDGGLDMLIGGVNSGVNLALATLSADKKRPFFAVGAATSVLTNEKCSPYTVHYAYDTVALSKGTGAAVVKSGGKSWYFLTADYAFGNALQNDTTKVVRAAGGEVVGSVRHPLSASDFSSFLVRAQSSKAQILGLANAGGDLTNAIKSASEFGVTKSMKLAALLMFINDVHALGLKATQGMYLTDSWYWNHSAETRAWSRRFFDKFKRMPSSVQAGNYSATLTYLRAVQAAGTDDGDKVMAQLKKAKINDMYAKGGYIRADGRMVHDMYLMQVKAPEKSTEPWDYYNVVQTIKGEDAFTTKEESRCSMWNPHAR
jgi:branched-chain amino acid transport system substrate-binding protein